MRVSIVLSPCESSQSAGSRVCCGSGGCYIYSVAIKIPKLAFCHISGVIRIIQHVFDKYDFVEVVSFLDSFSCRLNSHAFYQRKSAVDWVDQVSPATLALFARDSNVKLTRKKALHHVLSCATHCITHFHRVALYCSL